MKGLGSALWCLYFNWYLSSPARNSRRFFVGFFFHIYFHLPASLKASLCPGSPRFSALPCQGETPSQQTVEFE